MPRPAPLVLVPVLLAACSGAPVAQAELDYHAAMTPILERNGQMAKDFQVLAARIKKSGADGEDVAKKLDRQFIPAARGLLEDAEAVEPGNEALADAHGLLVEAWDQRVDHFQGVYDAWKSQDLDAYQAAADASYASKTTEDRYFREVNIALAPAGLTLQPYP